MRLIGILITVVLLTVGNARAQAKPKPKSPPKPVTTQPATTEDGKAVILSSNGTWKYASEAVTSVEPIATKPKEPVAAPVRLGSVDLEAGLVFNSGDVKPVGRATFYLLKEDPSKLILTQAHLDVFNSDNSRFGGKDTLDKWSMYAAILYMDGSLTPNFALSVRKTIDAAAVSQATTGFDGKAKFDDIPAGDYFLFGYYKFGKQTTYWSIPVTVKPGANKVVLDNDNMRG